MSTIKQLPSGSFQLRISNKILPKDYYTTFSTREAAEDYGKKLDGMIKKGFVPQALLERKSDDKASWQISRCIVEYLKAGSILNRTGNRGGWLV